MMCSKARSAAIAVFLSITGFAAPAQQLETASATDIVKDVVWEVAKETGKVSTIAGMGLDVMEILLLDTQMYGDVGRGIYWSSSDNRTYEYDWGARDAAIPRGDDLYRIYAEMKKAGVISKDEMRDVLIDMQYTPKSKWTLEELPENVRNKINAMLKISNSPDRKDIVKNAVQRAISKALKPSDLAIDTIVVSATGEPAQSEFVLLDGVTYVLKVSGTFQYDEGEAGTRADAQHEQNDDLVFTRRNFLAINGQTRPADNQTGTHVFEYRLSGNGEKLTLHIEDSGYGDNAGSLTADLFVEGE